ncbi:MAG: terminase small subunit [Cetobacterium sp.]|uniref:terminase small subunit n=1 Tax=Cetobacterium sp. TaxID=2071632 RepID=UPI002FCBE07B
MARERDPKRDLAFQMWKDNKSITNREIARILEVDEKKIATWKLRDNWKGDVKKNNCSTTKKKETKKRNTTNVDGIQQIEKETENNKKKIIEEISMEVLNDDGLTEKQRMFCVNYIKSFNATQSAIKAGYSKDTAMEQGCRLLRNVKVKEYLNELKEFYAQDDYLETKRILERHKQIAFADLRDYIDKDGGLKDLSDVDGTLIKKITVKESSNSQGYSSSSSIELEDRSKSLDFLNKVYELDPVFEMQRERLKLEKEKIKILEERNRILESENKDTSSKVEDMSNNSKLSILKKYGGA